MTQTKGLLSAIRSSNLLGGEVKEPQATQLSNYVARRKDDLIRQGLRNTYAGLVQVLNEVSRELVIDRPGYQPYDVFSITSASIEFPGGVHAREQGPRLEWDLGPYDLPHIQEEKQLKKQLHYF